MLFRIARSFVFYQRRWSVLSALARLGEREFFGLIVPIKGAANS
jgi:hypothetical protein